MMKTRMLIGAGLLALAGAAGAQPPAGGHDPMAMLDADGNGAVSLAEIRQHAAQAFARIDADGDGNATMEELRVHHEKMGARHEGPPGPGGHRGPPPGGPGHGGPGGPGGPHARMDANGDGAVTLAEFTAGMEAHFARADLNHDGSVTREEMQAAHRGMRGRR
ncbi:MAG: hypothetical protein JOZ90_15385 [Alphaproteobacteria bacterium]|nr:hypothetical protein [Alphaproteobacteria bacterium]MBV9371680.1 hypothetical protein [Alphaproteobacteria bacterium]MBV9902456.1 hypothetical protein [Alphaproteobacteria bacterium]